MKNGPYELVVPPEEYPGKLYRDRYCYEHHLVWWKECGELPDDQEVIHHKNGDRRDNRIENLEKINVEEHSRQHMEGKRKMAILECPNCGKRFIKPKNQTHLQNKCNATFCSRQCAGEFYGKDGHNRDISNNIIKIVEKRNLV